MLEQRNQHRPGRQEGLVNSASGKAGEPHPGSLPEAALDPFLPAAQRLPRSAEDTGASLPSREMSTRAGEDSPHPLCKDTRWDSGVACPDPGGIWGQRRCRPTWGDARGMGVVVGDAAGAAPWEAETPENRQGHFAPAQGPCPRQPARVTCREAFSVSFLPSSSIHQSWCSWEST